MGWNHFARLGCLLLGLTVLTVAGCGKGGGDDEEVELKGVGATFPEPLYQKWFSDYEKANPNASVNYQGQGSGAGIAQFTKGLVTFGASDAAMSDEEIAKVDGNVVLLPVTAGSIVLAYNLPGVDELKLSRKAYAGIFLGKITKWDDAEIKKSNPNAKLPSLPIAVVTRADSSGTTFVFTQHLSDISPEFKAGPGTGKTVKWPSGGNFSAQKGNAIVISQIKKIEGSIGYVEYGFAKETGASMATLENKSGKFVKPTPESGQATLDSKKLPADLRLFITDPEGDGCYPIVTYTWLLVKKKYDDKAVSNGMKKLLKYCLTDGQKVSTEMGYIPLPKSVAEQVQKTVDTIEP